MKSDISSMGKPVLIYCADGNERFADIAIEAGFRYGAQLPNTVYHWPYFADQDWRNSDRQRYMAALAKHRPHMATVLDWEHENQLPEVLAWAEEAAQYVEQVLVVPKVIGGIGSLPRVVGGKSVTLAYSVPTKYGGTQVPIWEFIGWPVHLLGGSPQRQMEVAMYLDDVVSIDGNMANLMATRNCQFWVPGTATYASNRWWPSLREANGGKLVEGDDLIYEAFRRSCENIIAAWTGSV